VKHRIRKFFKFFQAARAVDEAADVSPYEALGEAIAFENFRADGDRAERGWIDPSRPDRRDD
jgi:hypothetical protein